MKSKTDLVKGWLLKAESDLSNVRMCLTNNQSLDTGCFHAQQAAERFIKAYLTEQEIEFPLIHNLEKLIELCAERDSSFLSIKTLGQELTPYAVALRYDSEFWPDLEITQQAYLVIFINRSTHCGCSCKSEMDVLLQLRV